MSFSSRALMKSSPALKQVRTNKSLLLFFLFCLLLNQAALAQSFTLTSEDEALLNQIQKDSIQYFIRMSHKKTGLTKDSSRSGSPASIAATGFALPALAIGAEKGWIPEDYAKKRILLTLRHLWRDTDHQEGFFYHFLDAKSGDRVWTSEASSIDTALLVAGALLAGEYYPGSEIQDLAHKIYERVNWKWMMNGSDLISMGWKPESGFLPYYWDSYNELIILHALALGSPTHPVPPEAWQAWFRNQDEYNGKMIVYSYSGSLFTYQFAQAFIDFRDLNDRGINYFDNSTLATIANREYSLSFRRLYKGYSESSWGLSASLGPGGYKAYGGKPGQGLQDGTLAPYAAISSIVFTPELSVSAAHFFYENYKEQLYGLFGFKDAFNLDKNWWADEYLGIDQGITVLMLENFLSEGSVWKKFHRLESIKRWIELAELVQAAPAAAA